MNKTQLVTALSEKLDITKKDADSFLKAYEAIIKENVKAGEKVQSIGFGTFEISERKARDGINPKTKEKMKIPASKSVKFKVSKGFKDLLNDR